MDEVGRKLITSLADISAPPERPGPPEGACMAAQSRCECWLPAGHDGPHECGVSSETWLSLYYEADPLRCWGSWSDDGTIVRYPNGATTLAEALTALLGFDDPSTPPDTVEDA